MTLIFRNHNMRACYFTFLLKPVRQDLVKKSRLKVLASQSILQNYFSTQPTLTALRLDCNKFPGAIFSRSYSSPADLEKPPPPKPGLIQRFKQMYRDYWYVMLPVHLVTSAAWFGGFYYIVRSGVDVLSLLEAIGLSEKIISPMRDSSAGYVALAYALYKIATPLRYTVTIGGTTIAINKLTAVGLIKPVPSRERIKEMIQEKKDDFQDAYEGTKNELRHRRDLMKERKSQVMEDLQRYKQEMRNIKKNEVKK